MIGKIFGKTTVLELVIGNYKNGRKKITYLCKCDCGNTREVFKQDLLRGMANHCKSCARKTHGLSHTKTYRIYQAMFNRCYNIKNESYSDYGGRGIKVSERWQTFENFVEDMGIAPDNLQLDRIDNDGNYELNNCRWATAKENQANRRNSYKHKGNYVYIRKDKLCSNCLDNTKINES